jgi:hypothetical protein
MIFDDLYHKLKGFDELFPKRFFLPELKIAILGNDRYVGMFKVGQNAPDYVSTDLGKTDKDVLVSLIDTFDHSKLMSFDSVPPDMLVCGSCDDSGMICRAPCPECDGDGTVDLSNEHNWYYEIECKSCRGRGDVVNNTGDKSICPDCYGSKHRCPAGLEIVIDGMNVRAADARWLCNEDTMYYADKNSHRLAFKTGDVFGFILRA